MGPRWQLPAPGVQGGSVCLAMRNPAPGGFYGAATGVRPQGRDCPPGAEERRNKNRDHPEDSRVVGPSGTREPEGWRSPGDTAGTYPAGTPVLGAAPTRAPALRGAQENSQSREGGPSRPWPARELGVNQPPAAPATPASAAVHKGDRGEPAPGRPRQKERDSTDAVGTQKSQKVGNTHDPTRTGRSHFDPGSEHQLYGAESDGHPSDVGEDPFGEEPLRGPTRG